MEKLSFTQQEQRHVNLSDDKQVVLTTNEILTQ
jgi:hypothetical protein